MILRRQLLAAGAAAAPLPLAAPAVRAAPARVLRFIPQVDWASMTPRRSNRGSVDQGGWSVFFTAVVGSDLLNPGGHFTPRAQGAGGYYPLGHYEQPTAHKANLTGLLDGFATFWNIRRV